MNYVYQNCKARGNTYDRRSCYLLGSRLRFSAVSGRIACRTRFADGSGHGADIRYDLIDPFIHGNGRW